VPNENRQFSQFLRWAQILILKILYVFLWLKFSPALNLKKFSGFRSGTKEGLM